MDGEVVLSSPKGKGREEMSHLLFEALCLFSLMDGVKGYIPLSSLFISFIIPKKIETEVSLLVKLSSSVIGKLCFKL